MRIYHGCPSPAKLQKARATAPSFIHGAEWLPSKMPAHDWPYILDNGCYAVEEDYLWDPDPFFDMLATVEDKMPRDPDFVVLPDVPGAPDTTLERSLNYLKRVRRLGYDYYLPIQEGNSIRNVVSLAQSIEASGIFIGKGIGPQTRQIVELAHEKGLGVHIGRPGTDLTWARDLGADSVDTTTIVRNEAWGRLRRFENSRNSGQLTAEVFY